MVTSDVRLRAGELGILLGRNNVGVCEDATGRMIRYGLCNDSAQMNKRIKSSDLVGVITWNGPNAPPQSVYGVIALPLTVECKRSDWVLTPGDDRGQAQKRFLDLIKQRGGVAGFVRSVQEFDDLVLPYVRVG